MALPQQFLDEVRNRTLLSDLIGRRVRLQRKGREHVGLCPFHKEKTPSFTVVDDKAFWHCLAGETNVMTRDGLKPIASLAGTTAMVLTRGGKWVSAPFKSYGRQQLYRIELSRNGLAKNLFATADHRWFVRGRKTAVTTVELLPAHRLEAALPRTRKEWQLDPEGVRHGIVFGDGTVSKKGSGLYGTVHLHGEKATDLARWFRKYKPQERYRQNGARYVRVYGGREFGHMRTLPSGDERPAYLLGFIAGYLATDGHVAKDGTVLLNCKDASVLQWVRDIAVRLGIGTYGITAQMRKGYRTFETPIHRIHFVTSTLPADMLLRVVARRRFRAASKKFDRLRWVVASVSPTDREEEVFCAEVPVHHAFALEDNILTGNCFGCGAHGDAIGYLVRADGLSFIEAVERLAADAGLQMPQQTPQERERAQTAATLQQTLDVACGWYEEQLHSAAGRTALAYLRERGLDDETITRFRLGFAPDSRSGIKRALASMPEPLLVESGLLIQPDDGPTFDRFRARVIFPITDRRGRVIAFGGRVLPGSDAPAKYLNSPDSPLFDKGRTLFGLATARAAAADGRRAILVEGYMDAIALARSGFPETVAGLGTALTESHIEALWSLAQEPVICFDGDEAGARATQRAAERALPILKPGKSLRFAALPAGDDPDSFIRKHGPKALGAVLEAARPLSEVIWEVDTAGQRLDSPEARAGLDQRLQNRTLAIADRKVQHQFRQHFRQRLSALVWGNRRPGKARGRERGAIARVNPTVLQQRREQALLAAAINHPELVEAHGEALGSLHLEDPALDRIRQALIAICADGEAGIGPDAVTAALAERGLAEPVTAALEAGVYVHSRFARRDAPAADAEQGFARTLADLSATGHAQQLSEAVTEYLAEPDNPEAWNRIGRLKRGDDE